MNEQSTQPTPMTSVTTSPRPANTAAWAVGGVVLGFFMPVFLCVCLLASSIASLGALGGSSGSAPATRNAITPAYVSGPLTGDAVAIIDVNGPIVSGDSDGGGLSLNGTSVAASGPIVRAIKAAAKDPSVKVILLSVDSPGGSVIGSDEIYHALKNSGKPVLAYMNSIAASGGYYVSMGAKHIMAHPNTFTGSIGVISEFTNYAGLYDKLGLQSKIVKSAENKDFGAPTVPFTAEDEKLWQDVINETYEGFLDIIVENRGMPRDDLRKLADGRVYTGKQALANKLIDELGYFEDAVTKAASLGGISGEPRVVRYRRSTPFAELLGQGIARGIVQALGADAVQGGLEYR
jgi:protease IV